MGCYRVMTDHDEVTSTVVKYSIVVNCLRCAPSSQRIVSFSVEKTLRKLMPSYGCGTSSGVGF